MICWRTRPQIICNGPRIDLATHSTSFSFNKLNKHICFSVFKPFSRQVRKKVGVTVRRIRIRHHACYDSCWIESFGGQLLWYKKYISPCKCDKKSQQVHLLVVKTINHPQEIFNNFFSPLFWSISIWSVVTQVFWFIFSPVSFFCS